MIGFLYEHIPWEPFKGKVDSVIEKSLLVLYIFYSLQSYRRIISDIFKWN